MYNSTRFKFLPYLTCKKFDRLRREAGIVFFALQQSWFNFRSAIPDGFSNIGNIRFTEFVSSPLARRQLYFRARYL
jgi:hypothetical protein